LPGENILHGLMVSPFSKIVLIFAGALLSASGIYSFVKKGLNTTGQSTEASTTKTETSSTANLNSIKEAKDLLDSGAITESEFSKIKSKLLDN
jgi:putative oligomerization/nucleic acid binding protein